MFYLTLKQSGAVHKVKSRDEKVYKEFLTAIVSLLKTSLHFSIIIVFPMAPDELSNVAHNTKPIEEKLHNKSFVFNQNRLNDLSAIKIYFYVTFLT